MTSTPAPAADDASDRPRSRQPEPPLTDAPAESAGVGAPPLPAEGPGVGAPPLPAESAGVGAPPLPADNPTAAAWATASGVDRAASGVDQPTAEVDRPAPSVDQPSEEITSAPRIGRTRISGTWVAVIVAAFVLIFLLIFILQNLTTVTVNFLGLSGSLPLGVAMLFAAIAGAILVALIGTARILQLRKFARRVGSTKWSVRQRP